MTTELVDPIQHEVTVSWDRKPEAYRAACSCGWVDPLQTGWRPYSVERGDEHLTGKR